LPPGHFGGSSIDAFFTNRLDAAAHPYFQEIATLRVSAHVLIARDGELVQYVPFGKRAWHAGSSSFCGRQRCNDFSIGIELEGTDDTAYEPIQYRRLAALASLLMSAWPTITKARIVGHQYIAPSRKTDPGPTFEWERLFSLIA
jgi:AmpD protein